MLSTPWGDVWTALFVAALVVSPLLILAIAGVLFAPFASALSAIIAAKRGRSVWKGLLGGFVASVVLFLPWVSLTTRHLGWGFSKEIIEVSSYLILYVWGLFGIGILATVGILWIFAFLLSLVTGGIFAGAVGTSIFIVPLGLAILSLGIYMWSRSRHIPPRSSYMDWPLESPNVPQLHMQFYLAAYLWSVATPLILLGIGWATLNFTFGAV